jgi:hypothetical protein
VQDAYTYETRLRAMLDARIKGEGLHEQEVPEDRGNVIDLMGALKKSLGQTSRGPRRPPRAGSPPRGKTLPHVRKRPTAPAGSAEPGRYDGVVASDVRNSSLRRVFWIGGGTRSGIV